MKYIQLICCFKPISSSLADQAKNDYKLKYNRNYGKNKKNQ